MFFQSQTLLTATYKKVARAGCTLLFCFSLTTLQLSQPITAFGTTPSNSSENIPTTAENINQPKNSLAHMQSFFNNVTKYFGTRYRSGGQTPAGFDCSGFVRFMYDKVFNMTLPRSSREMSVLGKPVNKEDLRPGDLVFFNLKSQRINHVGIFIGNDTFVHSSLSKGITEDQLKQKYYESNFAGAVRLLEIPKTIPTVTPNVISVPPASEPDIVKPS